jgi:protein arginine kinase
VGCGICYEAFRDVLKASILQLQGTSEHGQARTAGAAPPPTPETTELGQGWLETHFALETLDWLSGKGPDSDVVISSRLRLARNLSRHPFPGTANEQALGAVFDDVSEAVATQLSGWTVLAVPDLSQTEVAILKERHLLSPSLGPHSVGRGFASLATGIHSLMINEEDHLRWQTLRSGLVLNVSLQETLGIASELESVLAYATSPQLGYLTTCPSNLGTGLRASALLHLPALAWLDALPDVVRKVASVGGLTLRGLRGEESPLEGPFLQLSNQLTLGRSEAELVANVETVARSLVEWERRARERLAESGSAELEDAVWRAWGAASNARLMTAQEAVEQLGTIRLGVLLGILSPGELGPEWVTRLLIATGVAHLERSAGALLSEHQADAMRATLLRTGLA